MNKERVRRICQNIKNSLPSKLTTYIKVNRPNIAYPNQHTDIEIPYNSRECHCVKYGEIKFNLDMSQ